MKQKPPHIALAIVILVMLPLVPSSWAGVGDFSEGFETATLPGLPAGWAQEDVSGVDGDWFTSAATVHPYGQSPQGGSVLAYFNSYSAGTGSITRLYRTTGADLSGASMTQLSFWVYHDAGYIDRDDRVQVQASTDGGVSWQDVDVPVSRYDGTTGWKQHTVSLDAFIGPGNMDVRIGLLGISEYGNDVHIDDLELRTSSAVLSTLPEGWAQQAVSGTQGIWSINPTTVHPDGLLPYSGSDLIYFNAWSAWPPGTTSRLYCSVNLEGVADARFSFWLYHDSGYPGSDDHVQVQASVDGISWYDLGAPISRYDGSVGWKQHVVSLNDYVRTGYTRVHIGLLGISEYGNDIHIDDLAFESTACAYDMCSGSGEVNLEDAGVAVIGDFSIAPGNALTMEHAILPPSMLARQDYLNVYNQAQALLNSGVSFRTGIAVAPTKEITELLKNYASWNSEAYFYRFCAEYNAIDEQGYCPPTGPVGIATIPNAPRDNVRNQLIRARELFAFLSLSDPADTTIPLAGQDVLVRQLGRAGVLQATREIANVHMIFGNEFLVDALDYRFSASADLSADKIIEIELQQLGMALQQFTLGVDVLAHAFNADFGGPSGIYIGDYFTEDEFELFGIVSGRMVMTMDEIANRYRQLGQDDKALTIYSQGSTAQYMQALALANKALERDADFLNNGGWEMMNNLGRLRALTQMVHDGLNPFGFTDKYVPVHPYSDLYNVTKLNFHADAEKDEDKAKAAEREFDHNATALQEALQSLRTTYGSQLLELCGASEDNFVTCEGGLMEQNYLAMVAAAHRIQLAHQRLAHIPDQIRIEQDLAGQVINITIQGGQALSALSYAIGVRSSYRETKSVVDSTTDEWHAGVENTSSVQGTLGIPPSFGVSNSTSVSAGYRHSQSKTTSVSKVWDPSAVEIGKLSGLRDVQQAATQAQITGANSEATIRKLLLQQADLMIELDLTYDEWNRLSAEHNHLVEKYHNLLNLRAQAQDNLANSYLNNPAYRILRDTTTIEAARSHGLAAQFAYLAAKALEYEFLTPVPFMGDIYMARTADDIANFLNRLEQWRLALGSPGYLNRYPYNISIAQDLLGLSDQNLDPHGTMTPSARAQLRYELFQDFLRQNTITGTVKPGTNIISATGQVSGTVEFQFTTSLLDNTIFSPNIWNNRIAGVGLPEGVPGTQGLVVNVLTRQFGDVDTPELILTHGGQASYRTSDNKIVEYTPGRTMLVGYTVPPAFQTKGTRAVILCSVNGNGQGSPNSALFNLSVAASSWTLKIDPSSYYNRNLDISQIEDIELHMDSTGVALAGRRAAAKTDSLELQSEFDGVPLKMLLLDEANPVK